MLKLMTPLSQETYGSEWCPAMDAVSTHSDSPSSRSGRITQVRSRFWPNPYQNLFFVQLVPSPHQRLPAGCLQANKAFKVTEATLRVAAAAAADFLAATAGSGRSRVPALQRLFPDIVSSVAQGLYRQNSSGISQEVNLLVSSQPLFYQSSACCTTRIS